MSRENVVVDTNVLVSATFWRGASRQALIVISKSYSLILCQHILDEYYDILSREEILDKVKLSSLETSSLVQDILEKADIVNPTMVELVCTDPDDDPVIACAVEARANFLVTQDKHLLVLEEHEGVRILTPEKFLEFLPLKS